MTTRHNTRRSFLTTIGAAGLSALTADCSRPSKRDETAHEQRVLGASRREYGERSPYEKTTRYFSRSATPATGSSRTPLQDLYGIITPSALRFERHHSGVPQIDPAKHRLLMHGLLEQPTMFTMEDLKRFPSVSRIHFIECAGNSSREQEGRPGPDPQKSHGLVSCSEWTGVTLRTLLNEVGLRSDAAWIVAEGADACRMSRSIPLDKALDDVLAAYGQNGEALRPEQGYPLRLIVPGWEGNINIKWLHRLKVTDRPVMSREEAAIYTDLMTDGSARRFTFVMEAKSVITRPAGGQTLAGPGFYEITGFAWSGRGRISTVEISTDGGRTWQEAQLNEPVLSKGLTRFSMPWRWDGRETSLQSRCTDETGYIQPTREELIAVRGLHQGPDGFDHYNGIKVWYLHRDGRVTHV